MQGSITIMPTDIDPWLKEVLNNINNGIQSIRNDIQTLWEDRRSLGKEIDVLKLETAQIADLRARIVLLEAIPLRVDRIEQREISKSGRWQGWLSTLAACGSFGSLLYVLVRHTH